MELRRNGNLGLVNIKVELGRICPNMDSGYIKEYKSKYEE